jgi:anti-sigma B factor antagonist
MRLKESIENGIAVLTLEGEIDLHYAPVLRTLLQGKITERCPALIVDLARVSFIDSAGLAALIEYFRDSADYGGLLCLAGVNENLHAVLQIVRLDQVLPIFASTPEAVAAVKAGDVQPPAAALFGRSAA